MDVSGWCTFRRQYISRLARDLKGGKVDADIVDLLALLNSVTCIATTSSCSGRIAVFAAPSPGDKRRGGRIVSWHRCVDPRELVDSVRRILEFYGDETYVWISAQPLILTLYTLSEEIAGLIVSSAQRVGLKYSGYRRVRTGIYYVFLLGTERIDIPLSYGGRRLCTLEGLEFISEVVNSYLMLAKRKLERFKRAVSSIVDELKSVCSRYTGGKECGDEATLFRVYNAMKNADLSELQHC